MRAFISGRMRVFWNSIQIHRCVQKIVLLFFMFHAPFDSATEAHLAVFTKTLGIIELMFKSHGAANQRAFAVAIEQAMQAVERRIPERIAARLDAVLPKSD